MAIMRKPVSQRRFVKSRKATMQKRTYTPPRSKRAYKPLDTNSGTNPQSLVIHRGIGLPDTFRTRLVWNESVSLTGFGTSIIQRYTVRMNGPYDPQESIGGTQPNYFDQLATLYNRYFVRGAKITVRFGLPTTTAAGDGPYVVGIQCGANASTLTNDVSVLVSTPNTGHKLLTAGAGVTQVTGTYTPHLVDVQEGAQALVNDIPTRQWFANVFASPQGTSTAGTVNAMITVEYLTDFFELKPVIDT